MSDSKLVNENEIDKENSVVLDFGQDDEIIPENLPESDVILDNIILILEYMNTPEMVELRNNNNDVFVSTMELKFESFAEHYYSVFRMIISGKDISLLFDMLKVIGDMKKKNITVETGEQQIGTKLKQFLPTNFEEKLQKETVNNMIKKSAKKNKNKNKNNKK
jgi:hypothetical protein